MIDRYHLRYFLAVIDQGNFSRAATACNVAQPTLSVGIARLEATLGRPLFHRTNRRVELTEAGAALAAHARRIEAGFTEAERAVDGTGIAAVTRIGVLATIPASWIEAFLRDHRASGRPGRVEIVEGRARDLHERLDRGRIDMALTELRDDKASDATEPLFSEGYSLALSASHPLADRARIAAEELVGEPMIVRRHCERLAETSRHFTARGVRPFFPARTQSDDRALGYVRAGLGLTVMPDGFTAPGVARPQLDGFDVTRTIGLVFGAHHDPGALRASPAATGLVATIEAARER